MTNRAIYYSLLILIIMTGAMVLLRLTHNPAYLWVAMISPLAGLVASGLHSWSYLGKKKAILFWVVVGFGSLLLETVGVATGLIYGPYHYTHRLGPLFLGLTPYLIPITWFMMLYPSYVMARTITINSSPPLDFKKLLVVAGIGGLIMTSWDLVVDPVMVKQEHWVWETTGSYFGIPLQNFLGWWLTSFLLLSIYQVIAYGISPQKDTVQNKLEKTSIWIYLTIGAGNIAGAVLTGLWGPALIAVVTMVFWAILTWRA